MGNGAYTALPIFKSRCAPLPTRHMALTMVGKGALGFADYEWHFQRAFAHPTKRVRV